MTITGAIVLYAVCWFLCLFLLLPQGQPTQIEDGDIEPGTPGGAPATISLGRKFLWATLIAAAPVVGLTAVLEYEILTLDDFDFLFPASFKEPPATR